MANWAKEIMKLANDFCLNATQTREIVDRVNVTDTPFGVDEDHWKYQQAHSRIIPLIMNV